MKTILTMTVVVVVGVMLTTAIALARLGTPLSLRPLSLDLPAEVDDTSSPAHAEPVEDTATAGAEPVAVVEESEFDFGHLRNKTLDNRRVFKIRNEGQAPLEFKGSSVSCTKCTFVDLPKEPIAPGETGEVVVRWNVDTYEDHFRQSATVKTNDPEHEAIRLVITGKVVRPLQVEPQSLVFSNVQVGDPAEVQFAMNAYFSDDLKVLNHSFSDAATAEYFDVATQPTPKEKLPEGAHSGVEVTVKLKPGLPVGSFTQTLVLKTNLEEEPETSVSIKGDVAGAVTVFGKGWERDFKYLEIGTIPQSQGAKRTLFVLVHGDVADLKLDPPEVDEDVLKVSYGDLVEMKQGTVVKVPVNIEIPPGSALVNHMGGKGRLAQILISSNKPALGRVKLSVKFAVVAD
ncbi:MAG TPA: DUF1573 domain-containing protein [Pirellulales bacterium]|nr:DUF1573 domain-containing protein [Pirellulales bacterium]